MQEIERDVCHIPDNFGATCKMPFQAKPITVADLIERLQERLEQHVFLENVVQ